MKKIIPLLLSLSFSSFAETIPAEIKQGLEVLSKPSTFLKADECEKSSPDTALWCGKVFSWACIQVQSTDKADKLKPKLNAVFDKIDFEEDSSVTINNAYMKAFGMAEKEVYSGYFKKDDLNKFFDDSKEKIIQLIKEQKISASQQEKLIQKVRAVDLITPTQYVDKLIKIASNTTSTPKEEIRKLAFESLTETCGETGLKAEIFNHYNSVIICPGRLLTLQESHVKSKEEAYDGLSLMLGRAIGQSIDSDEAPDVYKNMGECYKKMLKNPDAWVKEVASTLSADFWGAQLFATRMMARGNKGKAVVKAIADGGTYPFCFDEYKSNTFRFDKIYSTTPGVRELLGCGNLKEAPACGI